MGYKGELRQTAVGTIIDPHGLYSEQVCVKSCFIIRSIVTAKKKKKKNENKNKKRQGNIVNYFYHSVQAFGREKKYFFIRARRQKRNKHESERTHQSIIIDHALLIK